MSLVSSIAEFRRPLFGDYELRGLSKEEFQPLWENGYPATFGRKASLDVQGLVSEAERERTRELEKHMGQPLTLHVGVFAGDRFVGWHAGDQKSSTEFYMRNSGILPEHQGKGLYTAMLRTILELLKETGFQVVSSKHNATNNRVIVPKLKAGFVITGLEISDKFGTLVRLEYFTNSLRRAAVDYRCGEALPSKELRPFLDLEG